MHSQYVTISFVNPQVRLPNRSVSVYLAHVIESDFKEYGKWEFGSYMWLVLLLVHVNFFLIQKDKRENI